MLKLLAVATFVCLLLWPFRSSLRAFVFAENSYFTASAPDELPERFRHWVPATATNIRLRTYQSGWWITVESKCGESDAVEWAISINAPLNSEGDIPALPDHSLPADQLGFSSVMNDTKRYAWHSAQNGSRTELVYDRNANVLYLLAHSL